MTETPDLELFAPPEAPVDMPYQVLERQREPAQSWLAMLRQLAAPRAPHR